MKYDRTFRRFDSSYPTVLSESIYEELRDNDHLTEQTFVNGCRKCFKHHLKKLKEMTKIEFLHLSSSHGVFELIAGRKETPKERDERIEDENRMKLVYSKDIVKKMEDADYLDLPTIDALLQTLHSKKERLTNLETK